MSNASPALHSSSWSSSTTGLLTGAGLIIAEATQISQQGQGYQDTPGIYSNEQVAAWRKVTDAVHDAGGTIVVQLMHADWNTHSEITGLPVEAPSADDLDARTEELLERISRVPINQLIMAKLALNSALLASGVANSGMISTVFDGVSRHTREGYAFQMRSATAGFRQAVRERDEPFGDWKR